MDPYVASNRLHIIKEAAGLGPADDAVIGRAGDVYDPGTGEYLGSLTDPGLGGKEMMMKPMNRPHSRLDHVFAILRVEDFKVETPIEDRVTVVKVVWSEEEASRETDRLNALAATSQRTRYFYTITRIHPRPAIK